MDDRLHDDHLSIVVDLVQDATISNAESQEAISLALNRLDGFPRSSGVGFERIDRALHTLDLVAAQPVEGPFCVATELDAPRQRASPLPLARGARRAMAVSPRHGTLVAPVRACERSPWHSRGRSPRDHHRSEGEH